jgi:sugar lactone lactonase YvrE
MALQTTVILDGLQFTEGPRWHEGKLWFSDMGGGRVLNVDHEGNFEHVVDVPGNPSGLGWNTDGELLVVSMEDQKLMQLDKGKLYEVADLSEVASHLLNDMVVDQNGRVYIGNFGYDFTDPSAKPEFAEIIMVTPDGDIRVVAEKMAFPNGMVITPDGKTLIVAESLASRITAFDIELDGSLKNRRTWANFDDRDFKRHDLGRIFPDGICLDAEGAIWVASPWGDVGVHRVLEGGNITHRVMVETQPFAVMLGGADRQTLFICTSILDDEYESVSGGSQIESMRVDVPGRGLP